VGFGLTFCRAQDEGGGSGFGGWEAAFIFCHLWHRVETETHGTAAAKFQIDGGEEFRDIDRARLVTG